MDEEVRRLVGDRRTVLVSEVQRVAPDLVGDVLCLLEPDRLEVETRDPHLEAAVPEALQKFAKAYMGFKAVIGNAKIYPDRILSEPAAIGLDYTTYLTLYQADKEGNDLDRKQPDQVGRDLLGMAYLSKDGVENPLVTVRQHLNELFGDINVVTKINLAVTNLTVEVSHAQA